MRSVKNGTSNPHSNNHVSDDHDDGMKKFFLQLLSELLELRVIGHVTLRVPSFDDVTKMLPVLL